MGKLTIVKNTGGLGRTNPNEDNWSALCMNGITVSGGAQLNTVYELNNIADAEVLGLDKAYDLANKVLVWHRIRMFFVLAPGAKLFIMLVSQATTLTQMADKTTANGLAKLLRDPKAAGKIKQAAIARNPASGYAPVSGTTCFDGDVLTDTSGTYSGALVKAQQLAEEEEGLHRPLVLFVEGRGFNGTVASALSLHSLAYNQVATIIAQDADVAALDALFAEYAAVEVLLGLAARRAVNECVGYVADGNIQNQADGIFVKPALSNNSLLSAISEADRDILDSKGFIIPQVYAGYAGVYLNDSYTCVELADDFFSIENNRVMNKAIRLAYLALVPEINKSILVDADSGNISLGDCKYFESLANLALDNMLRAQEISSYATFVNPDQNILAESELVVNLEIVPTGTARKIKAKIGFKNPFNGN